MTSGATERLYAIAELDWTKNTSTDVRYPIDGPLRTPAQLRDDVSGNLWTVVVLPSAPVYPGDTTVVSILPIMEEEAPKLLRRGGEFELTMGLHPVARGRILSVLPLVARQSETVLEALQRVSSPSRSQTEL